MTNNEVIEIREFRRFMCLYIYPNYIKKIIDKISTSCLTDDVQYNQFPQASIKFTNRNNTNLGNTNIAILHNLLINIFIEFLNDKDNENIIKTELYQNTNIGNDEKEYIKNALREIQNGNLRYLSLLFNLTCLKDNVIYVYL